MDDTSNTVAPQIRNHFVNKAGKGRPKAGIPYKIQNGNFGFYMPTRFFGLRTAGCKLILDLKTTNLRKALERIEACGLWVRLATTKKATF